MAGRFGDTTAPVTLGDPRRSARRSLVAWTRSHSRVLVLALPLLALGALAVAPWLRSAVLERIGSVLVAQDPPLTRADAIVIAPDLEEGGILEASDLVRERLATRVAVFAPPLTPIADEFTARGIEYEDRGGRSLRQLDALGVRHAELIRLPVGGSEDAVRLLATWCKRHDLQTVLVVTGTDHSRRLRRLVARSMSDSRTRAYIRASRYSAFNPSNWWQHRGTLDTGIIELQKLVLDIVRHPLS